MTRDRIITHGSIDDPDRPNGELHQLSDGHVYEMGTRHACDHPDCPASTNTKSMSVFISLNWEEAVEEYMHDPMSNAIIKTRAREVGAEGPYFMWNHLGERLEASYTELGLPLG